MTRTLEPRAYETDHDTADLEGATITGHSTVVSLATVDEVARSTHAEKRSDHHLVIAQVLGELDVLVVVLICGADPKPFFAAEELSAITEGGVVVLVGEMERSLCDEASDEILHRDGGIGGLLERRAMGTLEVKVGGDEG